MSFRSTGTKIGDLERRNDPYFALFHGAEYRRSQMHRPILLLLLSTLYTVRSSSLLYR